MNIRSTIMLAIACLSLAITSAPAIVFSQDESTPPEQVLADRYAPIAYLKVQDKDCGVPPYEGEPYVPLPVDMILDNDEIVIRDRESNDEIVSTGPSATELASLGPTTYMDFPGNPRQPGCTYETDERAWIAEQDLTPTVYAKVHVDEENNRLALQYWFFWYFNDWNNTHESDWEGIQLVWDEVGGLDGALNMPPSRIGYSQHGNGEVAGWGDSRIRMEDETHPLVYPAAGSHATFFSDDTFLAWGERNSGFGCDIAIGPSHRVPLEVVVIPDEIDPEGEFAWILYEGRWGERQPGAFNGPLGPGFNARWTEPFEVFETWRPFSIVVPDSRTLGPSMSEAFCTLTAAGSSLLLDVINQPWIAIPLVLAVVGLLLYFARASWPTFGRARALYADNWKLFLGIGLMSLPIGILFNVLQRFLVGRNPLKFVVQYFNSTGGAELTTVMAVGGVQQLAMLLIITPALVFAVKAVLNNERISVSEAYLGTRDKVITILLGFVVFIVVMMLLLITAIGVPIAIWLAVKWHFFVQAIVFGDAINARDALKQSFRVVRRGTWWRTLFSLIVFDLLAVIPGILIGFGLLTIGRTAVGFANGVSSLLYAVLFPLSTIAISLLYLNRRDGLDPVTEEQPVPESVVDAEVDPAVARGNA